MARLKTFKSNISLLWVFGICILLVCFVIISCGTDPQLKVQDPDKGQYAVDFSSCTGDYCSILLPFPDDDKAAAQQLAKIPIKDRPLTAEAWVNVKSDTTKGYIMGRINANGGTSMYVLNNVPKFSIRYFDPVLASGTDKFVQADPAFKLIKNIWTHIAGVLSITTHDDVNDHDTTLITCNAGVGAEIPHMDLYVNGEFAGCKSTDSNFSSSSGTETAGIGVNGESGVTVNGVSPQAKFDGIIDEVRLFNVERTIDQIRACKDKELGGSGECTSLNVGLIEYGRLNGGEGISTFDGAGFGSGLKEEFVIDVSRNEWAGGWTLDAAPITRAD